MSINIILSPLNIEDEERSQIYVLESGVESDKDPLAPDLRRKKEGIQTQSKGMEDNDMVRMRHFRSAH